MRPHVTDACQEGSSSIPIAQDNDPAPAKCVKLYSQIELSWPDATRARVIPDLRLCECRAGRRSGVVRKLRGSIVGTEMK